MFAPAYNLTKMAENKTRETEESVAGFINSVESGQQRKDSLRLLEIMQEVSGCEPRMWGSSIVGFGSYHYRYHSGHEGYAPLIGFSPRKAALSLYVYTGREEDAHLLDALGKFKMGKACIYAKKLSDLDEAALRTLMKATIGFLGEKYEIRPEGQANGGEENGA